MRRGGLVTLYFYPRDYCSTVASGVDLVATDFNVPDKTVADTNSGNFLGTIFRE